MLASPRRRRRLLKLLFGLAVVGLTTGIALVWGSSDDEFRPTPGRLVVPIRPERDVVLSREERDAAIAIAGRFIRTAVARERVADSWGIVHPQLRQGMTREEWKTGNIPVQPYPVDSARWRLGYSTDRAVGFEVLLQPLAGSKVQAMMFDIELVPVGTGDRRRWFVSSWAPRATGINQPPPPQERQAVPNGPAAQGNDHVLGAVWLIAPLGILLGTLLLVPVVVVVRDWRRRRLSERRYREHLAARNADRGRS